uniref:NADP-dependent oxidoreductase domain-containing protein n=1 Tax=Cuerna arida TaxID=1464854 RepID=A0A1B6FK05_9HEMI
MADGKLSESMEVDPKYQCNCFSDYQEEETGRRLNVYRGVLDALDPKVRVIDTSVPLNSGTSMPILGLGTYQVTENQIYDVLDEGLKAGYRHIDTAAVYHNEEAIGIALKDLLPKYELTREDIFITTKLSPQDLPEPRLRAAVNKSLTLLGVSYLDLYLIHWPGAQGLEASSPDNAKFRLEAWKTMVQLHDRGRGVLRSIGVSNFTPKHLDQIIKATGIPPAVNQVEFHPHYRQPDEMYTLCHKHRILLQAYSSLGGSNNKALLTDPVIEKIAENSKVTPAQILLRWALDVGYAVIPKSVTPEYIHSNTQLDFSLSRENIYAITSLLATQEKYAWDPVTVF